MNSPMKMLGRAAGMATRKIKYPRPAPSVRATSKYEAGTFMMHPAGAHHYDGAKDEEVIVQIMGIGPSATIRVDESGKPKN